MPKNTLNEWAEIMRLNSEQGRNERSLGRTIMQSLDEVHPLNEMAIKVCDIVAQINDLMLSATQTRGVKTPEEAKYIHERMVELRAYLNGLQETVTIDWQKE